MKQLFFILSLFLVSSSALAKITKAEKEIQTSYKQNTFKLSHLRNSSSQEHCKKEFGQWWHHRRLFLEAIAKKDREVAKSLKVALKLKKKFDKDRAKNKKDSKAGLAFYTAYYNTIGLCLARYEEYKDDTITKLKEQFLSSQSAFIEKSIAYFADDKTHADTVNKLRVVLSEYQSLEK